MTVRRAVLWSARLRANARQEKILVDRREHSITPMIHTYRTRWRKRPGVLRPAASGTGHL